MEARSDPVSAPISLLELLLAAAIAMEALAILLRNDPGGLSGDPDSYMRLARFRDGYGIFHGGFFLRDNAPYGRTVLWTMPFDGALAVFYAIGRVFTDPGGALYFAARVVSPFFCVTIAPLLFFGLRPFFSLRARVVMAGLAATAPALVLFSMPGDADHHAMIVWLSVVFTVALIRYLFLNRPRYRHAAAAGIAAALALWTSPEEFVVIGAGLSAVVLHRCVVERPQSRALWANDLVLSGAFSLSLTAAWLVDSPYEGLWSTEVDRLSIVYVSFAWLFSATLIGLDAYLSKRASFSRSRNLVMAALLGGMAFLCWVATEPDILRGPYGQFDRALFNTLIDKSLEMRPLWRINNLTAGAWICLILIWISFAVLIANASGPKRRLWVASAVLMIPVSLLGIRYMRSLYFAEALGAIPLGVVLAHLTRRYPKYVGYGAIAASTGLMLGAHNAALLVWNQLKPIEETRAASATTVTVCGPEDISTAIAPIENTDAIVMTDLDFAPLVLYLSPYLRTVAAGAGYSRNLEGVLDVLAFFNAHNDNDARAVLEKRGVEFVLICDSGAKQREDSFEGRALRVTPAWLEQVGSHAPQPGFRLFRVRAEERWRDHRGQHR